MGSENSNHMIQHPLPKDYKSMASNPNIYVSVINDIKLQRHNLSIKTKQHLQYQQQMFIYRKCHSDHIVAASYFQHCQMEQYCTNSYHISFYTEYPRCHFGEIPQFSLQEGCCFLIDALKGFLILSQKVGYFQINNKMILFDTDYRIKVWLSDNFSETKVRKQRVIENQYEFLIRILTLFNNKLKNPSFESYEKLIEKYMKFGFIKNCTLEKALNILIFHAQQKLSETINPNQKVSQPHKVGFIVPPCIKNPSISNKENVVKKNKRKSKSSNLFIPNLIQNPRLDINNFNHIKNSSNESLGRYSLATNSNHQSFHQRHIKQNNTQNSDFTFQMTQNLQPSNLLNNSNHRQQYKVFKSHEKQILTDKRKIRKSMDQYELYKVQQKVQTKRIYQNTKQKFNQPLKEPLLKSISFQINSTPNKPQNQQGNKRLGYEICQTKDYIKNTKTFKGDKLESLAEQQSLNLFIQSDTQKVKTRLTNNLKCKDSLKIKQSKRRQPITYVQNINPSNLEYKKATFDKVRTIKSIIYSDIANEQQKRSQIIVNSTNTTKAEQSSFGGKLSSFNKCKR